MNTNDKRILIVTSVSIEKEAVLRGIKNTEKVDVLVVGVGPIAAAARTAKALSSAQYSLVISAGIAGGFAAQAEVGSIVLANEIIAADLGAQTPEGFSSLDKLGFGTTRFQVNNNLATQIADGLDAAGVSVHIGPILTVSTITGTEAAAAELASRIPGAAAEAMEGFGVATASDDYGLPFLEIRAISNLVGPRDRSLWRIEEALKALESASSVFVEVLK